MSVVFPFLECLIAVIRLSLCSRTKHISNNVCKLNFQTVIRFTEDVAALLKMLVLFDQEGQAVLLQTNFQQLIRTIETSISIIWPPEETSNNVNHVSQVL